MTTALKMINLPWTCTRSELVRFLSQTLNSKVKYSRIIYDKQTGLSRGIAFVQFTSDRTARDVIRRGTLEMEGRTVLVVKGDEKYASTTPSQSINA